MQGKLDFKSIGVMYSELFSQSGIMRLHYGTNTVVLSGALPVVWCGHSYLPLFVLLLTRCCS